MFYNNVFPHFFFSTCVWWWVIFQFKSTWAYEWTDIHNMVADRSLCLSSTNNERVFIFRSRKGNIRFWMVKEVHCACYSSFSSSWLILDSVFTQFYNIGVHFPKASSAVFLTDFKLDSANEKLHFFSRCKDKKSEESGYPFLTLSLFYCYTSESGFASLRLQILQSGCFSAELQWVVVTSFLSLWFWEWLWLFTVTSLRGTSTCIVSFHRPVHTLLKVPQEHVDNNSLPVS